MSDILFILWMEQIGRLKTTTGCWAIFALLQAEHQNHENKLTQNNTHTQTSNNIHRTSINVHI